MRIDMISLFPEMFAGPFGDSITKRAWTRVSWISILRIPGILPMTSTSRWMILLLAAAAAWF